MDVQLSRAGNPRGGDPHDWNSFQNYRVLQGKCLAEHPFLDDAAALSDLDFEDVSLAGVPHIAGFGEFLCRRGVVLKVELALARRYLGNTLQVRGVSYNYVAWIPGRHLVLKYHNWHENPDSYIHRAYDPRTGRQILYEELTRRQFPVLSEVLDEAELLTRRLPG